MNLHQLTNSRTRSYYSKHLTFSNQVFSTLIPVYGQQVGTRPLLSRSAPVSFKRFTVGPQAATVVYELELISLVRLECLRNA